MLKNSNAVVRLDRMKVSVRDVKEMNIESIRAITVLNKIGNDAVHAYLRYDDDRRIKKLVAKIFDARGIELKTFKGNDFKDESIVQGGTLYSDSRFKYLEYEPISYPYTIEFSYTITTDNTLPFPSFYFIGDYNVAVEKSEYSFHSETPLIKARVKEKNFGEFAIEKKGNANSFSYTATHLLPIKNEALGLSLTSVVPHILVSPTRFSISGHEGSISDWNSFGFWMYHDLLVNRDVLPEATLAKMEKLTENAKDTLEKAKLIYQYVQNNTRYISVQVGIGGFQPATATEVDQLKYGDCKGLTNYTHALLKSVGIPSYYTHVEAGQEKVNFETDFASLKQGNHAILAIPYQNKLYWIDCTSSTNPFGFLGSFTDDREVLLFTPEGGKLARTPAYPSEINQQNTVGKIVLDELGNITCEVKITTKGIQYDRHRPIAKLLSYELEKYYKNYWSEIRNLKITKYSFENNKQIPEFAENITFEASNYAVKAGNYFLLEINPLNQNVYVPPSYETRSTPFEVPRGYVDNDSIQIEIPKGYKIEALPKTISLENEFGNYKTTLTQLKNGNLLYVKYFLLNTGVYPKEKYTAYRNFRKQIATFEKSKLTLVKI